MREEERRIRLKKIEETTKEQRTLKQKRNLYYRLKSDALIKLYFRLEAELKNKEILTSDEIKRREMGKDILPSDCSHDIWYFHGKGQMNDVNHNSSLDCYCYQCLDCREIKTVSKDENEEFFSKNQVIQSDRSFEKCRKWYCSLLCTSHTDMAYQKLLKKI